LPIPLPEKLASTAYYSEYTSSQVHEFDDPLALGFSPPIETIHELAIEVLGSWPEPLEVPSTTALLRRTRACCARSCRVHPARTGSCPCRNTPRPKSARTILLISQSAKVPDQVCDAVMVRIAHAGIIGDAIDPSFSIFSVPQLFTACKGHPCCIWRERMNLGLFDGALLQELCLAVLV
jgi:hypothetical protein